MENNPVNNDTEAKKKEFERRQKEQETERENLKIKKQQNAEINKDPKEMMLVIQKNFREQHEAISKELEKPPENVDINGLFENFNKLKEYFINASYSMTPYDKQLYKDQTDKLEKSLQDFRSNAQPKKKFAFSKKIEKKKDTEKENDNKEAEKLPEKNEDHLALIKGIENKKNENLIFQQQDLDSSFKLVSLDSCKISLNGKMKAVFLKDLQNCSINIGIVEGACFIDQCINCEIQIMAHQIRIHNSKNTTFLLYCTSKPIMEHSETLKFGKYKHNYDKFEDDLKESKFYQKENLWDQIQDFNWLKQEKSPNFELINDT